RSPIWPTSPPIGRTRPVARSTSHRNTSAKRFNIAPSIARSGSEPQAPGFGQFANKNFAGMLNPGLRPAASYQRNVRKRLNRAANEMRDGEAVIFVETQLTSRIFLQIGIVQYFPAI